MRLKGIQIMILDKVNTTLGDIQGKSTTIASRESSRDTESLIQFLEFDTLSFNFVFGDIGHDMLSVSC